MFVFLFERFIIERNMANNPIHQCSYNHSLLTFQTLKKTLLEILEPITTKLSMVTYRSVCI